MHEEKLLIGQETEIHQVGIIVKDLDKTVEFLSNLGLGPFTIYAINHPSATVHGKKRAYQIRTALSQQGAVQMELIEYQSGQTIQKEFLDEKGEGIHHVLFRVQDLDSTIEKFTKKGIKVLQEDRFVGGGGIAYMGTDGIGGIVMEILQLPDSYDPKVGPQYQEK